MRAVNLLPRDLESQRSEGGRLPLLVAGGGIAAVTAAAAVLFMGASGSVSDGRSELESLEAAIAAVPVQGGAPPAVAPGTIAQERSDRLAALSAALTTRAPVDRLLRELAYVLPEDAWLTGLTASAPAGAEATAPPGSAAPGAAATPGITIQGATYSHESVARVLARLAALPTLTNVRLTASARVEPAAPGGDAKNASKKTKPVVTFTITAGFREGGAA